MKINQDVSGDPSMAQWWVGGQQTGAFIRTGSLEVRRLINAAEGLVCSILHGDAETPREHNTNVLRCGLQRHYFKNGGARAKAHLVPLKLGPCESPEPLLRQKSHGER